LIVVEAGIARGFLGFGVSRFGSGFSSAFAGEGAASAAGPILNACGLRGSSVI
jgi:hypothetical protein